DHDVDRHAGKLALRGETDINDAGMRTRRQHAHTSSAYLGCDESLVENERIRTAEVAPEGHVTFEAGLVAGDSIDQSAHREVSVVEEVLRVVALDVSYWRVTVCV